MKNKPKPSRNALLFFMKITLIHTLITCITIMLGYAVDTSGQEVLERKVTLQLEDAKIKSVLTEIETQADVKFTYRPRIIKDIDNITLHVLDTRLVDVLTNLFGTSIDFEVIGKQIVLKEAPVAVVETPEVLVSAVQQNQVTGTVLDESGQALPGVNVLEKGTTNGTTTDIDGKYTLQLASQEAILVFSFIGYSTQEIAVSNQSTIDITLTPDTRTLQEVVVVGYGTVEKKDLTSSVVTVKSKDFLSGAFNSPLQMIDGKVAGVTISNPAAADPNRATDIQVRGISSLGTTSITPLIIIDGMPGGDLRNIAQQDIESITVLKDGSAAAIYGSRAANGVILVQTKKGKAGNVSVTYDSYIEHDAVAAKPDILSAEEFIEKGRDADRGARTNWYDELLRKNNFGQNHFLAVAGGNETTIFRISTNYREKSGIDIASDRREYGLRANFQQKALNGLLELGGNISYRVANEEYTNYGVFQQAVKLNPTLPIWDPNNPTRYNTPQGYDTYNPVQDLKTRENGADQTYTILDFNIKLNPFRNFDTQLKLAHQGHDELKREYYTSQSKESIDNNRIGRARLENERWADWTMEWIGNYYTTVNSHDIKLMGGYSYQEFNNQAFWSENANFPSDAFGYNNLGGGSWNADEEGRLGMDSWKSKEKTIAFFGRVNYDFRDTYLFTGSLRYEGNTKFGVDNKWGYFPAVSAAWRISNIPAISSIGLIDDLKIRVSYGETGSSGFPRYLALAKYQDFGYYQNDQGLWIKGYGPGNNPNSTLQWEKQTSLNFGIDYTLLENKISGSIDAFIRKGKDAIAEYDVPVPPYLHDKLYTNVGTTSARGVELNLNWNVVNKENFTYTTSIIASYIKSKLDKFSNETYTKGFQERYWLPSPGNPGHAQRLEDDTELGSFYGYRYAGVDENGNIQIWKDAQVGGDRILAANGASTDRAYLGHGAPHYELSWGNTINYRRFDLTLFFRGRFDYQILNLYQMYYGLTAEPGVNLLTDAYGRNGHIQSGKVITDYFLEDGDYFKLDNITLGWSPGFENKVIKNLRIYGTVRNAFTITKYSGLDPTTVSITGLEPGIGDLNVYPIARNFALGAQITF